jgi:site-specific recombinase XerD
VSTSIEQAISEFLAYLRETPHRFNSKCPRAMKPINSTTIQKYYRALYALFNWSVSEGILEANPLVKIKVPRAEKKVAKSLSSTEVNQLILHFRCKYAILTCMRFF